MHLPFHTISPSPTVSNRDAELQALRTDLSRFQRQLRRVRHEILSTGIPALDSLLPEKGLPQATLCEWIAAESGCGTMFLALRVAAEAQRGGPLIVIDRQHSFYPPAFLSTGVSLANTIFVRPESRIDELWAMEQSLRCPGVGAVLCGIDRLKIQEFRRLQLAAESGSAIGLLIRPAVAQRQSSWANVRFLVTAQPSAPHSFRRGLKVQCLYAKGNSERQSVRLEICDETNAVCMAAKFSDSAVGVSGTATAS